MTDRIPDILLDAASVIETRGWNQGGYVPGKRANDVDLDFCPVCVLGAINCAADYLPDYDYDDPHDVRAEAARVLEGHLKLQERAAEVLQSELAEEIDFDPSSVVSIVGDYWNDHVATSAEQVITALRECAAELKAGA